MGNAVPGHRGGVTGCARLFGAVVAKLKVGQVLILGGKCRLVFNVPAVAALDGLSTTFCLAICLGVAGRGTPVVNEVTYRAGVKFALKLCTTICDQLCTGSVTGKHSMHMLVGVLDFLGLQGLQQEF